MSDSAEKRFRAKCLKLVGGCWEWTGHRAFGGYGQFFDGGRLVQAHRWAYERWVGPIPKGYEAHHRCEYPPCVNPAHLQALTPRENTLASDTIAARNAAKTHCIHGHPLSGDNLLMRGTKRKCRTCKRAEDLASWHRRNDAEVSR